MMKFIIQIILICSIILNSSLALDKQRDCKCKVQASSKIIGGKETKTIYPFLATFFMKSNKKTNITDEDKLSEQICHGVIINERMILTTSLCIQKNSKPNLLISYGSNDLFELYDNKIDSIIEGISHPNLTFHNTTGSIMPVNDLGIIFLKYSINFTEKIQPACFNLNNTDTYVQLTVIGHGVSNFSNVNTNQTINLKNYGNRYLKEINVVDVSSIDRKVCWYDALICSNGKNGNESPCFKDHGAPLMQTENGKTSIIGLFSYPNTKVDGEKISFCNGNQSSLYTRISKFWNWVKIYVGDDFCS